MAEARHRGSGGEARAAPSLLTTRGPTRRAANEACELGTRPRTLNVAMFSIEGAAQDSPDRVALVTATGVLTYAEMAARARRVAAHLQAFAGKPVALVPTLRPETIVAMYALLELGSPMVLLHPRLTSDDHARLVAEVDAAAVLDATWSDADLPEPTTRAVVRAHDPELAMAIVFTSGSSGAPKGVVLSRRAFAAAAEASAANIGWQADDQWLLCMPLAHVGGLSVVVRCLAARIPVVLSAWTGSAEALIDDVARHRATILSLVPTMLKRILQDGPPRPFGDHVRAVFLGGDAARPALLEESAQRRVPVLTTYGLTEACSQVATQRYGTTAAVDGFIGPPLPGVEIRIVGGEVQVRGKILLTGYFPTDRSPSPFAEGGWFPTGDEGEIDGEGALRIRGRRSDVIITGGENVDPTEVERVLAACAGVREVCVFGVDDERWGQIVAAAIVPCDPASPPPLSVVVLHVRERLAAHKQPRVAGFCEAIALSASGKIDRRATAALVGPSLVALAR